MTAARLSGLIPRNELYSYLTKFQCLSYELQSYLIEWRVTPGVNYSYLIKGTVSPI
jgi:hypothetical protein